MSDNNPMRAIIQRLIDDGLLLEAAWQTYRSIAVPVATPISEVDAKREAFFVGAQAVWGAQMNAMEDGAEPSEKDFERMNKLHHELDRFDVVIRLKYGNSLGSA